MTTTRLRRALLPFVVALVAALFSTLYSALTTVGITSFWLHFVPYALHWLVWALLYPLVDRAMHRALDAESRQAVAARLVLSGLPLVLLQQLLFWGLTALVTTVEFAATPLAVALGMLRSGFTGYLIVVAWLLPGLAAQRLHAQERRALELERARAEARLEALGARLEPHFLFNALHAISATVGEDPARAEHMLVRLGDLLRRALDEQRDEVPLEDELAFTEACAELAGLRFGERLAVDVVAGPEARRQLVPPLSVQLLVENAIKHGVAEGARLHVSVRAWLHDGRLLIEVQDDGVGMQAPDAAGAGGLALVRERLELLHEGRASLAIDSGSAAPGGVGTRVLLSLPATEADADVGTGDPTAESSPTSAATVATAATAATAATTDSPASAEGATA